MQLKRRLLTFFDLSLHGRCVSRSLQDSAEVVISRLLARNCRSLAVVVSAVFASRRWPFASQRWPGGEVVIWRSLPLWGVGRLNWDTRKVVVSWLLFMCCLEVPQSRWKRRQIPIPQKNIVEQCSATLASVAATPCRATLVERQLGRVRWGQAKLSKLPFSKLPFSFSLIQQTAKDPEIEGSWSEQRSVTDHPPHLWLHRKIRRNTVEQVFWGFRTPEERNYRTLMTSWTPIVCNWSAELQGATLVQIVPFSQETRRSRNPWVIKFHGRLGCWFVAL